jgi:hypothetical protein
MASHRVLVLVFVTASVALLTILSFVPTLTDSSRQPVAVMTRDGDVFALQAREGIYEAQWKDSPVLVVVTKQAILDGVTRERGAGEATPALLLPGGLAVFVISAKSTFLPSLGASRDIADYDLDGLPDGRFIDSCHQGQWDIYNRGAPLPNTNTGGRLASLRIQLEGSTLWGYSFDGPVGARANPSL